MQDRYEAYLTRLTADEYWAKLVETGWLSEIPEAQHGALETRVREAFQDDPLHAWAVLATVSIDSESIYGIEPEALSYHAHLTLLAESFGDVFRPTNIYNAYVNHHLKVSFEHDGRSYTFNTRADTDYVDPTFIDVINKALEDSGTTKRLIRLPVIDQVYYLVMVSESVYRNAERAMIIPPPAYYIHRRHESPAKVDVYLEDYYRRFV